MCGTWTPPLVTFDWQSKINSSGTHLICLYCVLFCFVGFVKITERKEKREYDAFAHISVVEPKWKIISSTENSSNLTFDEISLGSSVFCCKLKHFHYFDDQISNVWNEKTHLFNVVYQKQNVILLSMTKLILFFYKFVYIYIGWTKNKNKNK